MTVAAPAIQPLDLRRAGDREYALLHALQSRMRAERLPDDPPIPLDEQIRGWRNLPTYFDLFTWVVPSADGAAFVGSGSLWISRTDDNRHLADVGIEVLPEFRRGGLGRRLLAPIAETAAREGRRLLIFDTSERVPAGEAFARRLGADKGLETHTNQLVLADLDRALIGRWLEEAQAQAARFELGFWSGPYPEDDLAAIAALHEILNGAPTGDLDLEDFRVTPEHLRDWERSAAARGTLRWTSYVRERATGAFAGFSEIFWHPTRPAILNQGATGVFPAFRGNGLGRWLKAAMIERIVREQPEARVIRTGNADSNAPMLRINYDLGFKPFEARAVWQIELPKVRAFLDGREA